MVENVQCPVCTLFLHAGMNLSDHLETHPKEQVIKALVQMTVNSNGRDISSLTKEVLPNENKATEIDKTAISKSENDTSRSNSRLSTISNSSTICSTNSSLNFGATFSTQTQRQESTKETPEVRNSSANGTPYDQQSMNSAQSYQSSSSESPVMQHVLKAMNFSKNQPQHQQQNEQEKQQSNQEQKTQVQKQFSISSQLPNSHHQQNPVTFPKSSVSHIQQHRSTTAAGTNVLPPLPPSIPAQQQHQHTLIDTQNSATATTIATTNYPSAHHAMYAVANRQQHVQQQLQQQNMKIMYSGGASLPPPPPLQLFSYSQINQQHQKPPPAYGAAISQIRSQQNQNKQNPHGSSHLSNVQPQPLRHNFNNPPRAVSLDVMTTNSTTSTFSTNTSITSAFTSKHSSQDRNSSSNLPQSYEQKMLFSHLNSSYHYHPHHQQQHQSQTPIPKASVELYSSNSDVVNISHSTKMIETVEKLPPPLPQPQNSSLAKTSNTTTTSSTTVVGINYSTLSSSSRQVISPYPTALLAAPSPSSSSSVLRFAESPVAHYLERDNGDFIVQETPKHIVECVEEDDGEFSVTERFHQSPPSVLHIHDENEDEEEFPSEQPAKNEGINMGVRRKSSSKKDYGSNSTDDDQEFLSIRKGSDQYNEENEPLEDKTIKNEHGACSSNSNSCTEPLTNYNSDHASVSNTSTFDNVPKKNSKNSITVLSNVQLNLNEYLDLVGNIIASSKIANRASATSAASAPIPLVKVEKVELSDEEDEPMTSGNKKSVNSSSSTFKEVIPRSSTPQKLAKNNETDQEVVEYSGSDDAERHFVKTENAQMKMSVDTKPIDDCKEFISEPTMPVAVCSSHATSVIRMATAATVTECSQSHQVHEQQIMEYNHIQETRTSPTNDEENATAQDLSRAHKTDRTSSDETNKEAATAVKRSSLIYGLPPPPPLRKGPKKLVIKPKSTKTDENAKNLGITEQNSNIEMPSTSTETQRKLSSKSEHIPQLRTQEVVIKCEPNTSETNSNNNEHSEAENLIEQQSEELILDQDNAQSECKLEKSSPQDEENPIEYETIKNERELHKSESTLFQVEDPQSISNSEKDSVTEDARVLLDFANSTKKSAAAAAAATSTANFFSSNSLFSNCTSTLLTDHSSGKTISESNANNSNGSYSSNCMQNSLRCEDEFIGIEECDVQKLITSSCSQSAVNASLIELNQHKQNSLGKHSDSHGQEPQKQQQQQTHTFNDYPFSFFYNNNNNNINSNNNDNSNTEPTQKSNSQQFSSLYHQTPDATTTAATVASSSTLDTLDDSRSIPGESEVLENRFSSVHGTLPEWYQAATLVANSDFEAALTIDNAAVDGDVGKYLDLDACKQENISGVQMAPSSTSSSFAAATESSLAGGCTNDTLNIRTDEKMPPKGEISGQESNCDIENSWSQPVYGENPTRFYRTSFPAMFQHDNGWNQEEYFTVQDLSHSGNAAPVASSANRTARSFDFHLPLPLEAGTTAANTQFGSTNVQVHNDDVFPSTSLGSKKKRKRDHSYDNTARDPKRSIPTFTITSQEFLQNAEQRAANQNNNQLLRKPTTSTAVLLGDTPVTPSISQRTRRVREKAYQCPHCTTIFSKLRDRNAHMIDIHNYVRQNRRLISTQAAVSRSSSASATVTATATATATTTSITTSTDVSALSLNGTLLFRSTPPAMSRTETMVADSKHNIQIKTEFEQLTSTATTTENNDKTLSTLDENIDPKSELVEMKVDTTTVCHTADSSGTLSLTDTKPKLHQPLALTATATKLATLYRMLISFNVSTLKRNQNLSEFEEKLIESSIFFCYVCRVNFSSVKLYDAHLTEHPAECFTCGKKFQRWKNFSLHLKRHLGWKEFACNICDKKFVVRSALVEHTRMHTGQTPLKCKTCGKSFKRYSNLTQHRKRHARVHVRKKEYVCHCGEVLPSKARFFWHKETHDSKPKCCPHCCDRFIHANSLRRHIRLAHSDKFDYAEPMECPMCKQVFAKTSIKAHMATHSMDTQHDCNICNKSFSTKWNLKIHLWVHANRTAKPFKCEHCPKAFVREVDFKNHMNAHKQIKPYTCEYCGCKFIRKYNYMRHRREHHGNKKFTCDLCKKSFHRHYYLIEHRRIHTGERPFQCTICGKSSTTKTNHNKHLKIHHSRDPFTVET